MKIYRFSRGFKNDFSVREIEVEEKPKSFIAEGFRVLKEEINNLDRFDGMYCLSNDPTIYIRAMHARRFDRVQTANERLKLAIQDLEKWAQIAKENFVQFNESAERAENEENIR